MLKALINKVNIALYERYWFVQHLDKSIQVLEFALRISTLN